MSAATPDGGGQIFSTVELGLSDTKVHAVTTKESYDHACEWIDGFTKRMYEIDNTS